MADAPRIAFTDPDPDAVRADLLELVRRVRREHADGQRSFEDTIATLAAARLLVAHLLSDPAPPSATDTRSSLSAPC